MSHISGSILLILMSLATVVTANATRFYPYGLSENHLPPSMALIAPFPHLDRKPLETTPIPTFEKTAAGHEAFFAIKDGTSLYGTGEIAGPLMRNGYVTETWNHDAVGYDAQKKNLYQSHPWVLAVKKDGTAFGVLADSTYRLTIDLTEGIRFVAKDSPFPVVVIEGEHPEDVVMGLANLIGKIAMPPLWSLGYQQCRWSYPTDQKVREVASTFRKLQIPADVMWMDIDYMDGFRVFTFDKNRFPDPKGTNNFLHEMGFKGVWMIDPGVKIDPEYSIYNQGTQGDYWVKTSAGEPYSGKVWPGQTHFPDFTMPETRAWWAGLYKDFMAMGVDGVWNDMNEPAVFDVPTKTMPLSNYHRGGGQLRPGDHRQYHNVYGMLMAKASLKGILAAKPNHRPFLLTRSNYISGSRYAATWTGDNVSNWDSLSWSVPMILNLGLSGQPFSGADIGGFGGSPTKELFQKWIAVGALYPFSRTHTAKGTKPQEPWSYGEQTTNLARTAIGWRYRLMPYLYTVFAEAARTGLPVWRPLFFADPKDPALRNEDHGFLIGANLMVLPNLTEKGDHDFALPQGDWRILKLEGSESHEALPTLMVKAGAIIPLADMAQNTEESAKAPLSLIVAPDSEGRASGDLYEDAGDGFGYKKGLYSLTSFSAATNKDGKTVVNKTHREGRWQKSRTPQNIIIL